ncbi:arginine--tRNA ligase [Moraxella atlantae]|uniref:Arginine--tRNA ligase n=1 Tax=Faucicola atlantae TaxID=34059 RepID=A0A378Q146_9GAMM|nr:arginine--tRNA ligase [Moraxella atlantae]OPH35288.1 arginine--tRNA ligase [Moraxella atlantae]STY94530.1 Arginine--tRNA ligase [Moraxella atlantae]
MSDPSLIQSALDQAVATLQTDGRLPSDWQNNSTISRTKDRAHGDFASNLALVAAKAAGQPPRVLAQAIIDALPQTAGIARVELAGAGFINFFLDADAHFAVLDDIMRERGDFGTSDEFAEHKIQVEFVSANPTSSLHVGHGRGAAFGMSIANLLEALGYQVQREYYVNDAGRQMDILATSTLLRYLALFDAPVVFPVNGYQGDYVTQIAKTIKKQHGDAYAIDWQALRQDVPDDAVFSIAANGDKQLVSGDKEAHIDGLITNAKALLGEGYAVFHDAALNSILADIKDDLADFSVRYDAWFSEKSLQDAIAPTLDELDKRGYLYEQDGNVWFRSTDFGDEKDRVVRRANGQYTYFASDIAYHRHKLERGFDKIIDVWGADHHGYIKRVQAALSALGYDAARMVVILVQFVTLWRGDEQVQMSSRSGEFVTLRELREEVGNDAARFYYVARKPEQHMDFDLELAKSQSKDNAVYYIQYAHARICRVLERLEERNLSVDDAAGKAHQALLTQPIELELMNRLANYPDTLRRAALQYEPHILTNYLKDLASAFHGWYNDNRILPKDGDMPDADTLNLMQARLRLSKAVRQVIQNGLILLGLSAPTSM